MNTLNRKLVSAVTIVTLLFGSTITSYAFSFGEGPECESSDELLSDMTGFPSTLHNGTDSYDVDTQDSLEDTATVIFNEWKRDNCRRPNSVDLSSIVVVPVGDTVVYSEMNEDYMECMEYLRNEYGAGNSTFDYAVAYNYSTKNFLGRRNNNTVYCFFGIDGNGDVDQTNVDYLEATDSTIAAAAAVGYSGTDALIYNY